MSEGGMTTAEVADALGTDPKTLRKFFRSDSCDIEPVGAGRRYGIDEEALEELGNQFNEWSKNKPTRTKKVDEADDEDADTEAAPKKGKKAPAKKTPAKRGSRSKAPVLIEEDDDLDLDLEPTAEELEDLDDLDDLELD